MDFSLYLLFFVTSIFAVASPGPGVLMSLTSVIRFGFWEGFWAILGVASGTIIMAIISSTGLGILIATTPEVFTLVRVLGGVYMVYLAVKLLRAKPFSFNLANKEKQEKSTLTQKGYMWLQGIVLQMTNPFLIIYYLSVFPQFINHEIAFIPQLALLSFTHFSLVVVIHSGYGFIAANFRHLLNTPTAAIWVNRTSAFFFLLLAGKVLLELIA